MTRLLLIGVCLSALCACDQTVRKASDLAMTQVGRSCSEAQTSLEAVYGAPGILARTGFGTHDLAFRVSAVDEAPPHILHVQVDPQCTVAGFEVIRDEWFENTMTAPCACAAQTSPQP